MADNGNGGSGDARGGRGFASGLAIGAVITFVVTATLTPFVGFFSYPSCYLLDRSDDFWIGNYDKVLARFKENRLQEDDAKMDVEASNRYLASIWTETGKFTELRRSCLSALAAQQLSEQETTVCTKAIDQEYLKKIHELERSQEFHFARRSIKEEQLSKIQEEGDFLARRMSRQIEERAKLPEVCHQFFSMKTLDDLMKEPIRPAPVRLW